MSTSGPPRGLERALRFRDHGLGRDHQACDRCGVLQCDTNDLRRVDDAGAQHVDILLGLGVEAEGLRLVLKHFADHDRALYACVLGDLADRRLKRPEHDVDAMTAERPMRAAPWLVAPVGRSHSGWAREVAWLAGPASQRRRRPFVWISQWPETG
jgi:hypothetical protein